MLLVCAALLVLGLLVAFAIALASNQASSRAAITARVHDRAKIAAALVDTLFASATQQAPTFAKQLGGHVSEALLNGDAATGNATYLAVALPDGRVLAGSSGFTAQARAELPRSGALALISHGDAYAVGNMVPYGRAGVTDLAVPLATASGRRILIDGLSEQLLGLLLTQELNRIPGVAGSENLIVDGSDTVIASSTARVHVGSRFGGAQGAAMLGRFSDSRDGRYYDIEPLTDSTWKLVLSAPSGALFASISGLHRWVPWLLLMAFALVGVVALTLGWRLLHSAERDLARSNAELAAVNLRLASSNAQLERRATELSRSNAELDQFASIASHDLQEPLRKVRTFTQQLAVTEAERLSERGADYLMRANRAAERMQRLIQDLLQFSRVTTKPRAFVAVDLNEAMADVAEDLSIELEESGTELQVGSLPTLSADPTQMRQLLLNLVSNAIKFRRPGTPPQVRVSATVSGERVQLMVADNGIGFEPQYSDRIFKVFERLHGRDEYPGTGIGLALCQKIAARHNGEISAHGEPGVGATFTVTLPLVQQPEDDQASDASDTITEPAEDRNHVSD